MYVFSVIAALGSHNIQLSSVTLVGELLFKVSGISGKTSEVEDDEVAGEATAVDSSRRLLLEVLGAARRDRILAALYLVRQDGVVVVRQASMHIWKALVHNTPRTGKMSILWFIPFVQLFCSQSEKSFLN